MILERAEHPHWLSNAYLLADGEHGHGVLVDSNGVTQPLVDAIERLNLTITHIVLTHGHEDHVTGCEELARRFDAPLVGHRLLREVGLPLDETIEDGDVVRSGDLALKTIATPGHCAEHLAFLVDRTDCLTADCLFKGTAAPWPAGQPALRISGARSWMA